MPAVGTADCAGSAGVVAGPASAATTLAYDAAAARLSLSLAAAGSASAEARPVG